MNKGQFKKGQTGNPKGRPKVQRVKSTILNSHLEPTEGFKKTFGSNDAWIPFGNDNLFPQGVASITRRSPIHRGIVNYKKIYITGKGFVSDNDSTNNFFLQANNRGETLKQVFQKIVFDELSSGNAYLKIVKGQGFINLFHQDYTQARLSKNGESVFLHPNWANVKQEKKKLAEIPLYPNFKRIDGFEQSIVHFKSYEPTFTHYGIPDWFAGMESAQIAWKTNRWNVSRLNNDFSTSGVLVVDGQFSEKDAEELQKNFEDQFTGDGKQGQVMLLIKQMGGEGTQFTPVSQTKEGEWLDLQRQSGDDLIVAHNWFRSLTSMQDSTGFDTNRILNEYEVAHNTVIPEKRQEFIPIIATILQNELGLDIDNMDIVNTSSLSLASRLDANMVTKIWEARKEFGLSFDEDAQDQQKYVKNGTTNNSERGNK